MGTCLDQNQNQIDCGDPNCTFGDCTDSATSIPINTFLGSANGISAPTGANSPVAISSSASGQGGPNLFGSVLNFFGAVAPSAISAATGTTPTGLQQRINPANGQLQYYNPTTGQFVAGPVATSGGGLTSLFSGGSSFLLVIVAVVITFFAFGGRKRLVSA